MNNVFLLSIASRNARMEKKEIIPELFELVEVGPELHTEGVGDDL
jgi:hypothetical protein